MLLISFWGLVFCLSMLLVAFFMNLPMTVRRPGYLECLTYVVAIVGLLASGTAGLVSVIKIAGYVTKLCQ